MHMGRDAQRSSEAMSAITCIAMLSFAAIPETPLVPVSHAQMCEYHVVAVALIDRTFGTPNLGCRAGRPGVS